MSMMNLKKMFIMILIFGVLVMPLNTGDISAQQIDVFDFKETPISDVVKIFTELTGKNVVASKGVAKQKVTLYLKGVTPEEALKTMCKLNNLWFADEDSVIRIMSAEDYARDLTIRRDEKTFVYNLKHASSLAVADMLDILFGDRIEYVEPDESDSYGHIGTEGGTSGSRSGFQRSSRYRDTRKSNYGSGSTSRRGSRTTRKSFVPGSELWNELKKDLSSTDIERLEDKIDDKESGVKEKDALDVKSYQALAYIAVFPRNNVIAARSVDLQILKDIGEFISAVDTPTSQVLLEGKILEITLDDDFSSFLDFDISSEDGEHQTDIGNFFTLTDKTFIYRFIDKQLQVQMEFFEGNNKLRIIGTPMILCANNAEGEFFIGEERPITISYEQEIREYQERTTEVIRANTEYRDIGTQLIVTPSINADRTVTMRFSAEVDTVNVGGASQSLVTRAGDVIVLPIDTVDSSRVENIIVAQNNSTLAVGGLIRETDQDYEKKVPILADIPLLGALFRKKQIRKLKTETVFLITPHIMMDPKEGQDVSDKAISELSDHPFIKNKQERILKYNNESRKFYIIDAADEKENNERLWEERAALREKTGEILSTDSKANFAIINLGSNDGFEKDDVFTVSRSGKYIGKVKVSGLRSSRLAVKPVAPLLVSEIKEGDRTVLLIEEEQGDW